MEKRIFPEYSGRKLVELLEANADSAEERTYSVPLEPAELAERKDRFSIASIKIAKLQEKKKDFLDELKKELAPLIDEQKQLLAEIKAGAREEEGVVFKIIDFENATVGFYTQNGDLIDSRPSLDNEKQLTIHSINRTGIEL